MSDRPVLVAIGSNIDPETNIVKALKLLRDHGGIAAVSRWYRNRAVGGAPDQPDYINGAVEWNVIGDPKKLRRQLHRLEETIGRRRTGDRYAPRCIDLDLLLMGEQTISSPELTLPAPDILKRAFVTVPLADIAPDFRHPAWNGRSLQDIAEELMQEFTFTRVELQ